MARWLDRKDEPGTTEFHGQVVGVDGDVGFVKGRTRYLDPPSTYSNLWVIRLDDAGRAVEFTEWWMQHPAAV